MPRTLAYRSAAVVGDGPLVARLRREDVMFRVRWVCLFGLGLATLWLATYLVAWCAYALRDGAPRGASWPGTLACCAVIVVPILFAIEHVTRGKFLEEATDSLGLDGSSRLTRGFLYSYWDEIGLVILLAIFLWGPRMTLAAVRRLRAASAFATFSPAAGAAVLTALLPHDDGQPSADVLLQTQLDPPAFSDALAYLAFHDYVGIARDGTRVWLNTDARKRLAT
jgi:hypothetical protein